MDGRFDRNIINTIALWKVNRYPYLSQTVIERLNDIAEDREYNPEKHKEILIMLLDSKGVRLPMASTFLRFRNPSLFQIIDQRAYRVLTGEELHLPVGGSREARDKSCAIYFSYLSLLREKCIELDIPFEQADRILYNADKRINKGNKLNNFGG